MKLARLTIPVAVVLLAVAAAACGGGTSSSDKTSTASAGGGGAKTAVTGTTPASGGASKDITITAKDFSFSADDVDVSKGDTVAITFKNTGATTHTLAFYTDDAFTDPIAGADTGNVAAGATKSFSAKADAGLYYRCNIHPTQMKGEIEFK